MKRHTALLAGILWAGALHAAPESAPMVAPAPATVTVTGGVVQGIRDTAGTSIFRAIPFAAPPLAGLRWRAPEQATTSTSLKASGACARASAQAMTSEVHQRSGSCSAHPTCGCVVVSSERAMAAIPP